jgi:hypothetical protein
MKSAFAILGALIGPFVGFFGMLGLATTEAEAVAAE